jgi:hypothetical protein
MSRHVRNIQGTAIELSLVELDPNNVRLDPTNPRVGFSMRQLSEDERSEDRRHRARVKSLAREPGP